MIEEFIAIEDPAVLSRKYDSIESQFMDRGVDTGLYYADPTMFRRTDGGKVEFFTQVLTKSGEVEKGEKKEHHGPSPKKMIISVEEVNGHCAYEYKPGDTIEVTGLRTPEGFCGAAYNALFPVLFALNMGAKFPFSEDKNANLRVTCPDGGIIRFKVMRVE